MSGTATERDGEFEKQIEVTEVTIPPGVTEIKECEFQHNKRLTKIMIPPGVTKIGPKAFQGCRELTKITIPPGVTEIGPHAFEGCTHLTEIMISPGLTEIPECAFAHTYNLLKITIPDTVSTILHYAFYYCGVRQGSFDIHVSDVNKLYEPGGKTLLHVALDNGNPSMTNSLLDRADLNLLLEDRENQQTILMTYIIRQRRGLSETQNDPECERPDLEEQKCARDFFLKYRQAIIRQHGQNACDREMLNIADKLCLNPSDLHQAKISDNPPPSIFKMCSLIYSSDPKDTHQAILHQTAVATAINLRNIYLPGATNLPELPLVVIQKLGDDLDRLSKILDQYLTFREPLSGLGLRDVFFLVCTGLSDVSYVEDSKKTFVLRDNLDMLKSAITLLIKVYEENVSDCFNKLFNIFNRIAYSQSVPGTIVLMDECEKEPAIEMLRARHGLVAHYQRLRDDQKAALLEDKESFEGWRELVLREHSAALARYEACLDLQRVYKDFNFLKLPLQRIRQEYACSHADFKRLVSAQVNETDCVNTSSSPALLPVFELGASSKVASDSGALQTSRLSV